VNSADSNHKEAFFRQALWILLPMLLLAAVGLRSLRQDHLLVRQEAGERARAIAEDMLPRLWAALVATNEPVAPGQLDFEVGSDGEFVAPTAALPGPQATMDKATQEHQRVNEFRMELYAAARPFFVTNEDLAPSALSAQDQARGTNAVDQTKLWSATGSNQHFAIAGPRLFWFNTTNGWRRMDTNWSVLVRPVGRADHKITTTFDASRAQPPEIEDYHWLAIRRDLDSGRACYRCRSESEIAEDLRALVTSTKRIPDYLGIGVEIAGRRLAAFDRDLGLWRLGHSGPGGKGGGHDFKESAGGMASEVLGRAKKGGDEPALLEVKVYLTSSDMLFLQQRARTFWFGALLVIAAATGLVGLAAAGKAYRHQAHLSELKSNFVAGVSHELRAPLAAVRLMAESLERGTVSEPARQQEYFRAIGAECRRLSALIENVLTLSRSEQGREEYQREPTDLAALLRETALLMEPCATEKRITLALLLPSPETGATTTRTAVDGKAIEQVLVNLIDNAIKHSPPGTTVTLGMEYGPDDKGVSCVRLWVEDQGAGIPGEEQEKIFERFYRVGCELRRETQGAGIGLSIVRQIVEAHDGRVLVRSATGEGSRFTVELPVNSSENGTHPDH
jgi:signal transduction histidine kinase